MSCESMAAFSCSTWGWALPKDNVTSREIQEISGRAWGDITAEDGPGDEGAARFQRCLLPRMIHAVKETLEDVETDRATLYKLA